MTVYAFDFDGTLTSKDTFVEFILFVKGKQSTYLGFLLFLPILVLMKIRLFPNWKAKQMVFSWFFKGMEIDEFNHFCTSFAHSRQDILRQQGFDLIAEALAKNDNVIIITASIENWVAPFFSQFDNRMKVEGTKIAVRQDRLTGQFLSKNCYGTEKVKRLYALFPYRRAFRLVAFGDSRGDKQLLAEADEAHYKPFRATNSRKFDEIVRFLLVGCTATALQYGIYLLLLTWLEPRISNTIGYLLSFIFNYFASTRFTFKVKSTVKRSIGFAFSHLVNYLLQIIFLSLFLYLGVNKAYAMLPVFGVCVPINFLLVRTFLKGKS
ncbi:MAG: HAD-IB family phosphatase [Prevotella sp.]|nr:HAD-IB family phosphatase [Prevotellaceae bacterium]MDY3936228.1 HAD-IB family phosphatase [Prevotella sp.]